MKDIKSTVAKNLALLRKSRGITQAELAERFNYSDKAVCRWECGDTLPDINVLGALCDFYDITMNDLVNPDFEIDNEIENHKYMLAYRVWTCIFLCTAVWLLAAVIFSFSITFASPYWLAFVWAIPVTCLVIFRSLRDIIGTALKIIISSLNSWSIIAALYLHVLVIMNTNIWYVFIVGLPIQGLIIQYFMMKRYKGKL